MKEYLLKTLQNIVDIDSPSGFCSKCAEYVCNELIKLGIEAKITNKGAVEGFVKGESSQKTVAIAAHIDTLGAMVRSITPQGHLNFTTVGGPILATLDGEYCRVHTRGGKIYTGTFLCVNPSVHVSKEANTTPRDTAHMYIRLDERVKSAEDTKKLGIQTGDYIAIEPKFAFTESGYVKSRFLDDKASAAIILAALKYMKDNNKKPKFDTKVIFTVYEEVGHGGSAFYKGLDEVLAIDMGCIGADLACTEHDVSICATDSGGPYDYEFTGRLINLAKENNLSYAVDAYPFYGSDIGAMLRAGADIKGALIGTGVHASHGMERTHTDGMINTYKLLLAYLGVK